MIALVLAALTPGVMSTITSDRTSAGCRTASSIAVSPPSDIPTTTRASRRVCSTPPRPRRRPGSSGCRHRRRASRSGRARADRPPAPTVRGRAPRCPRCARSARHRGRSTISGSPLPHRSALTRARRPGDHRRCLDPLDRRQLGDVEVELGDVLVEQPELVVTASPASTLPRTTGLRRTQRGAVMDRRRARDAGVRGRRSSTAAPWSWRSVRRWSCVVVTGGVVGRRRAPSWWSTAARSWWSWCSMSWSSSPGRSG